MPRYSVACELDLQHYDRPRVGYRHARRAHAELRRLGRFDDGVRATRLRRKAPLTAELSVVIDASTTTEAFARCNAMLRSAVHASGGRTAGWERLDLEVDIDERPGCLRSAPSAHNWAIATDIARRRGAVPSTLPPLSWMPDTDVVVDLRPG